MRFFQYSSMTGLTFSQVVYDIHSVEVEGLEYDVC